MAFINIFLLALFYVFSFSLPAFAYLDPGTGSMLLSAVFGIFATLFFVLKGLYYKIISFIFGLFGMKIKQQSKYGIAFYSEGKNYWHTFKPVLKELDHLNHEATYLTSDKNDPVFNYDFKNNKINSVYIGEGNTAYMSLNMLEADILALTTPGIDVLQIKRSKGVKHYSHIIHSCTDLTTYKLYSFDYYDSLLLSGEHQIKTMEYIEKNRNITHKKSYLTGVVYMDELIKKLKNYKKISKNYKSNKDITVLIAPAWGKNGLLTKFGEEIIEPILNAGYKTIIRPHPQSYKVENDLISSLQNKFKNHQNLSWDNNPDGFDSLFNSDIMVSDLSGVVFDYAFCFEKPVLTVDFEIDWTGQDGNFVTHKTWELTVLNTIGKQIKKEEFNKIDKYLKDLLSENKLEDIRELRKKSIVNFGTAGKEVAKCLIKIHNQLR